MSGSGIPFTWNLTEWKEGVDMTTAFDKTSINASPWAKNAVFNVDGTVEKRKGARALPYLNVTTRYHEGTIGQYTIKDLSTFVDNETRRLFRPAATGSTGKLLVDVNGNAMYAGGAAFSTDIIYATAQVGSVLYFLGRDETSQNLARGCVIYNKGSAIDLALYGSNPGGSVNVTAAIGAAGSMTGDYEFIVAAYNSYTGALGGVSIVDTLSLTSDKADLSWTYSSSDGQATHYKVYIRKLTLGTEFLLATTVDIGTTAVTLDISDSAYNALTTILPTPLLGLDSLNARYLAWHKNRLFAATESRIYYSDFGDPTNFGALSYEEPSPDDAEKIKGLFVSGDALIIFRSNSLYALIGDDPYTWSVRQLSPDIGCTSQRSVAYADGLLYWWSEEGPIAWDGVGNPIRIGKEKIDDLVGFEALNLGQLALVQSVADTQRERVIFAVPPSGRSELTLLLPFNYRLRCWEGWWDAPVPITAMGTFEDPLGFPQVLLGGSNGIVYRLWESTNDGVVDGTTSAAYTAAASTTSTVTIGSAAFNTTPGLTGLYAYLEDSSGNLQRERITSNTATSVTVAAPFITTTGAVYTFYVGTIDFIFETAWLDGGDPWKKKRFEYVYVQAKGTDSTSRLKLQYLFNYSLSPWATKSLNFHSTEAALWDNPTSQPYWGWQPSVNTRTRVGRTGNTIKLRVYDRTVNIPFVVTKIGVRGEALTDKR